MAYDIVIPPWLHGPRESLAETYLQAFAAGNRIAQTQIDRQMQAEQEAMKLEQERQLRQQQIDKNAMLAMTRLRVQQAHDNAMAEVAKQNAKANMDRAKIAVDAAARQAAARRQFEIDTAGGMKVPEAIIKNPEAFPSGVFSGALRSQSGSKYAPTQYERMANYVKQLRESGASPAEIALAERYQQKLAGESDLTVKNKLSSDLNSAEAKLAGEQARLRALGKTAILDDTAEVARLEAEVQTLRRMRDAFTAAPLPPMPPSATEQYQPGQMNPYPLPMPVPQAAPVPQPVPQAVPQVIPQPVPQPARPRAGFKVGKYDVLVE